MWLSKTLNPYQLGPAVKWLLKEGFLMGMNTMSQSSVNLKSWMLLHPVTWLFYALFFSQCISVPQCLRGTRLCTLWNIWSLPLIFYLISDVAFTHFYHTSLRLSQVWCIRRCVGLAEWWYWWTLTVDAARLSSSLLATYRACSLRPLFPTHLS